MPDIMQKRENNAKVKGITPQPSDFWGENVGIIFSMWNPDLNKIWIIKSGRNQCDELVSSA